MKKFVALAAATALGLATAVYAQDHQHQPQSSGSSTSGGMHEHMQQMHQHMGQMQDMHKGGGMGHMDDRMGQMSGGMAGMGNDQTDAHGHYATIGEVVSIKEGAEPSVTIRHEAVPALKWPAMTMAFHASAAQINDLHQGDAVAFQFKKGDKGRWVITQLKKAGE